MAYNGDYVSCIGNMGGKSGGNIFTYVTTDNASTIAGAAYFADASDKGMKEGDLVIVTQVTTLPDVTSTGVSVYTVSDITAAGAGTVIKTATS